MKQLILVSLIVLGGILSNSVFAATILNSDGTYLNRNVVTEGLLDAVDQFELNAMPVLDTKTNSLSDVFIHESTIEGFRGLLIRSTILINDQWHDLKEQKLMQCPKVITYEYVDIATQAIFCDGKSYVSLKALCRYEPEGIEKLIISETFTLGQFTITLDYAAYTIQFEFSQDDLVARMKTLNDLRSTIEKKRFDDLKIAEKQRFETDTRIKNSLNEVAKKAIMLDDIIAFPLKAIASVAEFTIEQSQYSPRCFDVKQNNTKLGDSICDEEAWGTTNFVSKNVSGQIYAPLVAINDVFTGFSFVHDAKSKTLNLKILEPDDPLRKTIFTASLPQKLSIINTKTRALIFPYTKDNIPSCSVSITKRKAYTLFVTSSRPYKNLDLSIKNVSSGAITVLWDETSLRLINGSSSGVIHEGTRFSASAEVQANTPIAPRSTLNDSLVAKSALYYSDSITEWVYDLFYIGIYRSDARNSITVSGSTSSVSGSLALQVAGKRLYEPFKVTCKAKTGEFRK